LAAKRHFTRSNPAPVGGLNVRDAINSMAVTDAVVLTNWIPQQYGVRCRKGYRVSTTGLGGPCQSILSYQPDQEPVINYRLFAITDSAIYDVTTPTNAPVSSFTLNATDDYGRFSSIMFTNSAGSFLLAASQAGGYFTYDGVAWVRRESGDATGKIAGIDPNDIVFVTSWKRRTWFVEKDSTNAWYLPTDQITGEATKFELGPFVKRGGKLAFIVNWTIDAGEGIDDLIVFVFEGGDVLIYKGTDPASASTFSIVGSYYIGAIPVGRRGHSAFGGDVLIVSELGLQPLSYVTRGGQSILRTQATDYLNKIQPRIAELVSSLSNFNGWDITLFAKENLLLVQIPPGPTGSKEQYALYTNNNQWCKFEGLPMICATAAGDKFWFGTASGEVCEGFSGYFDAVPYGQNIGSGIAGAIQPAYSYFGFPGMSKQFHMVRPTFIATDRPGYDIAMIADFQPAETAGVPVSAVPSGALWDTAIWDQSYWAGAQNVFADWASVGSVGFAGSLYIVTNCIGDTTLASIDYMFEPGGVL
jgi:hypothetical protein